MKKTTNFLYKECFYCKRLFKANKSELKRGYAKFCSRSCSRTHRNKIDNPVNKLGVKEKISKNHADVNGKNNPMYGRKGKLAPSYIDGRNSFKGEPYKKKAFANLHHLCDLCGDKNIKKLQVHHKDLNHKNNKLTNLQILCISCHRNNFHKIERDDKGRFIKKGECK